MNKKQRENKQTLKENCIQDRIFIITDMCMYEKNKRDGTFHPHAIEVVDIETGQTRYIRSGSKIRFIAGDITEDRNQDIYNKQGNKNRKIIL